MDLIKLVMSEYLFCGCSPQIFVGSVRVFVVSSVMFSVNIPELYQEYL